MLFADSKDLKRAQDLGKHSGAIHSSSLDIARGKASSMAQAITDKRKILGRLEAVASVWKDFYVLSPFIDRCTDLWPNSQYYEAYIYSNLIASYIKNEIRNMDISKEFLLGKYLITEPTGKLLTGQPYEFDEVARLIFNTIFTHKIRMMR